MARFYTNVHSAGNSVLVREVINGERKQYRVAYKPTMYLPAPSGQTTELHAPDGTPVVPRQFDSIHDCREFMEKFKGTENFRIYGSTNYAHTWINEEYPEEEIPFDSSKLCILNIDIEVACEAGFSEAKDATEQLTAITIKNSLDKCFHVFGMGEFVVPNGPDGLPRQDIKYNQCEDEIAMVECFLQYWEKADPDVVTGWNCLPLGTHIWAKDRIQRLDTLFTGDILVDSAVRRMFPTTSKRQWELKLANGQHILSSADHIFPMMTKLKHRYSGLSKAATAAQLCDMTVTEAANLAGSHDLFVQSVIHRNSNPDLTWGDIILEAPIAHLSQQQVTNALDNVQRDLPIEDAALHALGMIYTDGSAEFLDERLVQYAVYNTELDCLRTAAQYKQGGLESGVFLDKRGKGTHRVRIAGGSPLGLLCGLIYDGVTKRLNVSLLSRLSARQFWAFFAGLVDGDGSVTATQVWVTNYNDDVAALAELVAWNGCFSTQDAHALRLANIEINRAGIDSMPLTHPTKAARVGQWKWRKNPQTKAAKIKYRADELGNFWVRLDDVVDTGQTVPMMDIETDTHYFVASGVRTHNCKIFDIPYLVNRITRIMGESETKRLSPWKMIREKTETLFHRDVFVYEIGGVAVIDYMAIYRKNVMQPRESYSLNNIAMVELKEQKITYSEVENLHSLYRTNHQKFIEYNIHDVELVDRLDAKLKLIELQLVVAYDSKVNYEDVFSQVRVWDTGIHNHLLAKGVVLPQKVSQEKASSYAGAYVMEPVVGLHNWVVSVDVTSLYPTIMRLLNMGIETKIPKSELTAAQRSYLAEFSYRSEGSNPRGPEILLNGGTDMALLTSPQFADSKGVTLAANGVLYKRYPTSFYSEMIDHLFGRRVNYKNRAQAGKRKVEAIHAIQRERAEKRAKETAQPCGDN